MDRLGRQAVNETRGDRQRRLTRESCPLTEVAAMRRETKHTLTETLSSRIDIRIFERSRIVCPICVREFGDDHAVKQHVIASHFDQLGELVSPSDEGSARFEEALVRIVNSLTLEEATEIATLALLGEALPPKNR